MMKKDFAELEGTEVEVTLRSGGQYTGIVAGCHYDVGVTIVDREDKKRQLVCINGRKKNDCITDEIGYDLHFYCTTTMLSLGFYKGSLLSQIGCIDGRGGLQASCAFGA